jgi:ribonuclease P/MRP protein subunit POP5
LLWAAITLLTSVGGVAVLPRVVAVSGTIKKLQAAAIVHHRRVTAAAVATLLKEGECLRSSSCPRKRELTAGSKGEAEKETLEKRWATEREEMARLEAPE